MRRLLPVLALVALVLPAGAGALLTPGRTVPNAADVTALSVTHRSVVWAIGRAGRHCGSVRLWDTAKRGVWTFGERTIIGCEQNPSGGHGIAQVSTSGRRVFWVTNIGGNTTDYQLWTATPGRRTPRRIAFATAGTEEPPPIVLGPGTREGVAYAVGPTVTYVSDTGARLFRTTLDAPVRLLTAGTTYGSGRVAAALEDGSVVLLSRSGAVLDDDLYEPGQVQALSFAFTGQVVQAGRNVFIGPSSGRTATVVLPPGARMLDYRERTVYYRQGIQVRARHVGTDSDALLLVNPIRPWQPMLFSVDWGTGWAKGTTVAWRT